MPSSRSVGERTLEELVEAGEVKSVLILKGDFTKEEVELIRRGYEEGIKVYRAENELRREAIEEADRQLREYEAELRHGPTANAEWLNKKVLCARSALLVALSPNSEAGQDAEKPPAS